jgi:phenylacetate-CoA ligase
MLDYYDRYEKRTPKSRETALFRDLRALLAVGKPRMAALRTQLKGIDVAAIKSRADLACVPVLRKADLSALQKEIPPFGGACATRPGALKRLLVSPGPIYEPEGHAKDWWNAARALFAAGIRKGDILINCFSYHLTPGGHMMESGARALGCPVIPAGTGHTEQQLDAVEFLKPRAYCGTPDFLKVLLDKGSELKRDVNSIKRGVVSGAALPSSLRAEFKARDVEVRQAYGTADLGIVAYESDAMEGLIVNEGLIVEIVKPGTNDPLPVGEVGEIVVTRLNVDYPLLRFGTGDLSAVLPGLSPCGRTNMRIEGWMGRADQTAKVKGMFVHPAQVSEIGKRHPDIGRLRLVISRMREQDVMTLHAESRNAGPKLKQELAATLQSVTKMKGAVEVVRPGSLPNDGKIIADERNLN